MKAFMIGSVKARLGVALVLTIVLGACGGETGDAPEAGETEAAATLGAAGAAEESAAGDAAPGGATGYAVVDVSDGGVIRGTIRFEGMVPPPDRIAASEDAETCGEYQEVQPLVVAADGGLADAVVSLVDISQGAALATPPSPPALDQNGCRFSPHVLVVAAGAPVAILNSDPIMHNVHTLTFENRAVNRSQPPGVKKIEVEFPIPEKVKVRCDVHDWMSAWIIAVDHPYHVVTGADGGFVIEDVPPGTYTLEVWHESLGTTSETVTVEPGGTAEASIAMTAEG